MEPIYLSEADIEKLKHRKIGEGSEAKVYNVGNGILYKIYHNDVSRRVSSGLCDERTMNKYPTDDSDVKIVGELKDIIKSRPIERFFSYYDKEGVRIHHKNAIVKAVQRQSEITYTHLPKAPIFLKGEDKLLGCALKYHARHYNLHSFSALPIKVKIQILKKVLRNVEELINSNIYHIDLANKKIDSTSHSNILVSLGLEPQIIDIDGKSAIYTEKPEDALNEVEKAELLTRNQTLYESSLGSFATLLLDFIFDEDLIEDHYESELDITMLYERLEKKGLPRELSENLIDGPTELEALHETLNLKLKR